MPAHVRVREVDVLYFNGDRVGVFTATLIPFEYAAGMQPGNTREHANLSARLLKQMCVFEEHELASTPCRPNHRAELRSRMTRTAATPAQAALGIPLPQPSTNRAVRSSSAAGSTASMTSGLIKPFAARPPPSLNSLLGGPSPSNKTES